MRVRLLAVTLIVFGLMYIGYQQITAQNLVTCPNLVQKAIDSVGNNCGSLERNSACYGFNDVQASFSQPQPVGYFAAPSDRAKLLDLQDLITSPMQEADDKWGIALMSIQANLPDTLPGQSVVLMILGDTQVENAVAPADAFQTGAVVSVTMQIGAQLYFRPDFNDLVVGSVPTGTTVTADAISSDGQWVRVAYAGKPGWVTKQVINADADVTVLPVMGVDTKTPMQAFYFRTSISGTQCTEAPNALVVQGPKNLTVNINANGADMRLGSTIALYLLPVDPTTQQYLTTSYGNIGVVSALMQIIVLDGHVVLNAGKPNEVDLKTGETSFICMSRPENLGLDGQPNDRQPIPGCPWAPPRPVTVEDIEQFRDLAGVTLNYPIDLPLELPTLTPMPTDTASPTRPVSNFVVPTDTPTPTDTFTPETQQQQQPTSRPARPTHTPTPACPTFDFSNIPDTATLVAAINAANDEVCHPGTDTITLSGQANYTFTSNDNGVNLLPVVTSGIVVNGGGQSLGFSGESEYRFFQVNGGASLTLNSLTVSGGYLASDNGAAIDNAGTLALNGVTLIGNNAVNGGGINNSGSLTTQNSTIEGGYASGNGGGLYNTGTATLQNTTVSGNNTQGSGGAIDNQGTLNLLNVTISQNSSSGSGAGLHNGGGSSTLNFTTIAQNTPSSGAGVDISGGSVTTKNTIIASNGTNCSGTLNAQGGNFDDDGSCLGFTQSLNLNLISLNNNGGSTQTVALGTSPQSAAIDATDCMTSGGSVVGADQRGISRPQNWMGMTAPGFCDAGAFEAAEGS